MEESDDELEPEKKRHKKDSPEHDMGQFFDKSKRAKQLNFMQRPEKSSNMVEQEMKASYGKDMSSKAKLMKTLLKFKKSKRPSTTNPRGMQTVKMDF